MLPVAQHAGATCRRLPVRSPAPKPVLQALHAGHCEACREEERAGVRLSGCGGEAGAAGGRDLHRHCSLLLPGPKEVCCSAGVR